MIFAPLLLCLTGVVPIPLAGLADPPEASAKEPDSTVPGGYVALRKGRMTLISEQGVEPILGELGDRDMAWRGNLELGALSEAELRWAGEGSLRAYGPASIEWSGSPFSGDPLSLPEFRRVEVEVRAGELGVRLPGGVLMVARRSALEVTRRSSGVFGIHHLGGQTAQVVVPAVGAPEARQLDAGDWVWIDPEEYLHEPRFVFPTKDTTTANAPLEVEAPLAPPEETDSLPIPEAAPGPTAIEAPEGSEDGSPAAPEFEAPMMLPPVFVEPFELPAEQPQEPVEPVSVKPFELAIETDMEHREEISTEPAELLDPDAGLESEELATGPSESQEDLGGETLGERDVLIDVDPLQPLVGPGSATESPEPLESLEPEGPEPPGELVEPPPLPEDVFVPDFWFVEPVPVDPLLKLHPESSTEASRGVHSGYDRQEESEAQSPTDSQLEESIDSLSGEETTASAPSADDSPPAAAPSPRVVVLGGRSDSGASEPPALQPVEQPDGLMGLRVWAPSFPDAVPYAWMPRMYMMPLPRYSVVDPTPEGRVRPVRRASNLTELLNGLGAPLE